MTSELAVGETQEQWEIKWGPSPFVHDGYLYNAFETTRDKAIAFRQSLIDRGWKSEKIVVLRTTVERVA